MSANVEHYDIASVDRGEVLRYLGYAGQAIDPELDARIDQVIARCLETCHASGTWRVFDVDAEKCGERPDGTRAVALKGASLELLGNSIADHMEGAAAVGVMAVTVGMGVEAELRRLSLTNPVDQLIFDAAATTAVERAADACEARLVAYAHERSLYTNFRFSPGYGDMPLETQRVLLDSVDAQRRLGIALSRTNLMTPTKSVTAVVGMFAKPQPSSHASCKDCLCRDFCHIRATGKPCWAKA